MEELKQKLEELKLGLELLKQVFFKHIHDGVNTIQINTQDLFGNIRAVIQTIQQTIATTGNTDFYVIAPINGNLESIDFSGADALATSDTNYITFTITNLGQAGVGTTVMLATTPAGINTTKVTGGTAISANTKYSLRVSATRDTTVVAEGDRLLIRAAVTNTLANTVTFSTFILRFK